MKAQVEAKLGYSSNPFLPEHFEPELYALVYFIYWDFIYDYLQSFTDKVKLKGSFWDEDL